MPSHGRTNEKLTERVAKALPAAKVGRDYTGAIRCARPGAAAPDRCVIAICAR